MSRSLKSSKHWLWEIADLQSVRKVFGIWTLAACLIALSMAMSGSAWAEDVNFIADIQVTGRKLTYPADSQEYPFSLDFYVKNERKQNCETQSNHICLPSPDCKVDFTKTHVDSSGLGTFGGPGWGVFVNSLNEYGGSANHRFYQLPTGVYCLELTVEVCAKRLWGGGAWYRGSDVIYARCPSTVDESWQETQNAVGSVPENGSEYSHIDDYPKPTDTSTTVYQDLRYTASISVKKPIDKPLLVGMFNKSPNATSGVGNGNQLWAISSSVLPNIQVVALEITQGMQNLQNDMPLVEGRRTYLRAYVWSNLNIGGVSAKLFAERNGSSLGFILAEPINSQKKINGNFGGDRTKLEDSFLFKIPKEWRSGTVKFKVVVDSENIIAEEEDISDNFIEKTVTFQSPATVNITTVPFHLHDKGDRDNDTLVYRDSNASFGMILGNMFRLHPVSAINCWDCGIGIQYPLFHRKPFYREWDMRKESHENKVLFRVSWVKFWHDCGIKKAVNEHWVGMIHPKVETAHNGMAYPPLGTLFDDTLTRPFAKSSWVKMNDESNNYYPSWYSLGGATLAHELAHNKGIKHILCSGTEDDTDSGYPYPYPDCLLAKDSGKEGFFGVDVYHDFIGYRLPQVISNTDSVFPLMGYNHPRWTSPYEYCKLLRQYGIECNDLSKMRKGHRDDRPTTYPNGSVDPEKLQNLQNAGQYFAVGGIVDISSNTIEEYEVYQIDKPSPTSLQDAIEKLSLHADSTVPSLNVVQLDNVGKELDSHETILPKTDGSENISSFLELIPVVKGVTRIQIRRGTEVLAEKTASANPPTVKLLAPNQSGLLVAGTVIQWEAADADGDELSFNLFYSPDDGQSWRLVEMGLTGNSYELSTLANLPASEHGRFRIMAHDGFYTAYDDSDVSFSVPNSPPRAIIFQPTGMKYQIGETVIINGIATDIDDGPITNENQFSWTSDIDGYLGIGQELFTRKLSQGIHHITLSVVDSKGAKGSATIEIIIESAYTGIFTVGSNGIVKIDWLYDGGKYQGEFGIFNLAGMETLTPGSSEFIAEAVKRVLSNSDQGYLVFSDLSEGARFSGLLGGEVRDWNSGDYKGVKSFVMTPGTRFATILVPNSTFASLAQNPTTEDPNKRPLFSLVSSNPAYGMYLGQMADVNGMGKAYSYEDKDAATSDKDFNDLIVMITGATADLPSIDDLKSPVVTRAKRDGTDWRTSELGRAILEHVEAPAAAEDSLSMTVTLNAADTLLVYDPSGNVMGKDGGWIAGAAFEMKADGTQIVTLPNPAGTYRLSIQGAATAQSTLTVKTYQGSAEISSAGIPVDIAPHQILTTTISAEGLPPVVAPVNAAASYDFNGDGITDNADVSMLVRHWNSCKGQQKYDAFFDVNDDGCITVADIMTVLNAKTVK